MKKQIRRQSRGNVTKNKTMQKETRKRGKQWKASRSLGGGVGDRDRRRASLERLKKLIIDRCRAGFDTRKLIDDRRERPVALA